PVAETTLLASPDKVALRRATSPTLNTCADGWEASEIASTASAPALDAGSARRLARGLWADLRMGFSLRGTVALVGHDGDRRQAIAQNGLYLKLS
ncbi:MAG: hypothetical protein J0I07_09145, partial [Myxococcales bacterium]|nr:hypothetical protein [Myxococcales bacterium]